MDINWLDIVLIFSMLVSGLLALTQGFIKEALSIVGWIISFIAVTVLMPDAGSFLSPFLESDSLSNLITIGLIFLITLMLWRIVSLLIVKLFKITSIGYIDRTLGFIFGILRIYVLATLVFAILILPIEETERPDYIRYSNFSTIIEKSINFSFIHFPQLNYYISIGQESSSELIDPKEDAIENND